MASVCVRALAATGVAAVGLLLGGGAASANELPPGCTFDSGITTCRTDVALPPPRIVVGAACMDGVQVYASFKYLTPYERTTQTWQGRYANDRQRLLSEAVEIVYVEVTVPERVGGPCMAPPPP